MTRAQLRAELQNTGFGTGTVDVTRQNQWLDAAYLWVWHARDPSGVPIRWSFEQADQTALTVTSGAQPSMPSDFGSADWIYDSQGVEVRELDPQRFDTLYAGTVAIGQTEAYKVVNRQITFGPTPTPGTAFTMSYTRRVSHVNGGSVTTGGTFTDDADTPLWPDHHMILVYQAALIGHTMKSNPFAAPFQSLREEALQAMRADLEAEFAPSQVWGDGTY